MKSEITHKGLLTMQVCVVKTMSDEEVETFANSENTTGIDSGWKIRKQGDPLLNGDDERVQCSKYEENCHIMLDC